MIFNDDFFGDCIDNQMNSSGAGPAGKLEVSNFSS